MKLDSEAGALKKVPLFRGVDDSKLKLLAFISERVTFGPGEYLMHQGERGDVAYIILEGDADVLVDTAAGERRVAHVGANDFVGEIAILIDVPRTASIRATGEMVALAVSKDDFFKMLKSFPEMAVEVMRVLAQRLESTTRELASLRGQG